MRFQELIKQGNNKYITTGPEKSYSPTLLKQSLLAFNITHSRDGAQVSRHVQPLRSCTHLLVAHFPVYTTSLLLQHAKVYVTADLKGILYHTGMFYQNETSSDF